MHVPQSEVKGLWVDEYLGLTIFGRQTFYVLKWESARRPSVADFSLCHGLRF